MSSSRPPDDLSSALHILETHLASAPIDVQVAWRRIVGAVAGRPRRITASFERATRVAPFRPPIPREEPNE